jgi:hypothetical protein
MLSRKVYLTPTIINVDLVVGEEVREEEEEKEEEEKEEGERSPRNWN